MHNEQNHLIVTVTGPSGSGKTVLSKKLKDSGFEPLISTTTRLPRQGEVDGVDYYFLSEEQFNRDLKNGLFMENVEYNGVLYGVSSKEASRAFSMNKPAVLVAEPHGVEQIADFCAKENWDCFRVFVNNDPRLLLGRLLNRLRTDLTGTEYGDDSLADVSLWVGRLENVRKTAPSQENFLTVLSDMTKAFGLNYSVEKINAAAQRLKSFDFEQKNWVEPAHLGGYDYLTPSFSKETEDEVILGILKKVAPKSEPARIKL